VPYGLAATDDQVFFGSFATGRWVLWASDGTEQGTRLVADAVVDKVGDARIGPTIDIMALRDFVVFAARDAALGVEPWRSDGTLAGTVMLMDAAPGAETSFPSFYGSARDHAFVSTRVGSGSASTIHIVRAQGPATTLPPNVFPLGLIGDRLLCTMDRDVRGMELWSVPAPI
jgi:ELWxxDGT repeat protein